MQDISYAYWLQASDSDVKQNSGVRAGAVGLGNVQGEIRGFVSRWGHWNISLT
jgi:hypothetical protein